MISKAISIQKIFFLLCLMIFCLLLFKDVFSERSLIPNFEPFPDSFHYISPARNLVRGDGFVLSREGRVMPSSVGPLYPISLIPIYLINSDPRMFYFMNVFMALLSFVLFFRILSKISVNPFIILIASILYITNYDLYWFPVLAMAENLMLLLFLSAVYLIILPVNYLRLVFATAIALGFYLTKYASVCLTGTYLILYVIKIYLSDKSKKYLLVFLIFGLIFLISSGLYLSIVKNMNIVSIFFYYLSIFSNPNSDGIFSLKHISVNLPQYVNTVIGGPTKVLWDSTPILPGLIAVAGFIGLIIGSIKSSWKFLCISLLAILIVSILFLSTFYSFDARYVLYAIPSLILGFAVFLSLIQKSLFRIGMGRIFYIFLIIITVGYLTNNGMRLKNQIMINIKHAEAPWYYISVLELNKYFSEDKISGQKKPIVISAVAPYFIDLFSNNNYTLLPLSQDQEFRDAKEIVWGPNDYSDLFKLYEKYISKGYQLYVSKYGLGNEKYLHRDFEAIGMQYKLIEVANGCYNVCTLYKLELKK